MDGNEHIVWGLDEGVHEASGLKPMLTAVEQVKLLKSKGVTFDRCSEEDAVEALTNRDTFIHLASYRRLFQKHAEGPEKGRYIRLDFEDLLALNRLDVDTRHTFFLVTQDIERFMRTSIIARISEDASEDGYEIIADFMKQMRGRYRGYVERDLLNRSCEDKEGDVYSGRIISHYKDAMPVWAFLEVVTFGTLLAFHLFCADRWNDNVMREEHYVSKGVKAVRNCCSHGSCILNGMNSSFDSDHMLSSLVYDWLNQKGISNSKTRRAKLKNKRVQQLLETLVMFDRFGGKESPSHTADALHDLNEQMIDACNKYGEQTSFVSYLRFLATVIDKVDRGCHHNCRFKNLWVL